MQPGQKLEQKDLEDLVFYLVKKSIANSLSTQRSPSGISNDFFNMYDTLLDSFNRANDARAVRPSPENS
jgi:hypothetical protein